MSATFKSLSWLGFNCTFKIFIFAQGCKLWLLCILCFFLRRLYLKSPKKNHDCLSPHVSLHSLYNLNSVLTLKVTFSYWTALGMVLLVHVKRISWHPMKTYKFRVRMLLMMLFATLYNRLFMRIHKTNLSQALLTISLFLLISAFVSFFFFSSSEAWTQSLHLEPLHKPFLAIFVLRGSHELTYPGWLWTTDPPHLCFLSS
jgi:hypothetical protein